MLHRRGVLLICMSLTGLAGCSADFGTFAPGEFAGTLDCQMTIDGPAGEGQQPLTIDLAVTVVPVDVLTINGQPVEIGAMHLRSLPTADMQFEIVRTERSAGHIEVTLAPRPSLPGITATGQLVETYQQAEGGITVQAQADLTINDIDGPTRLQVACPTTLLSAAQD